MNSMVKYIKKEDEINDEQKVSYAYALNMCMVSVSQIIDYADIVVLEQEYDAILNNLNLEKMPKDEALLNVLKLLLDTITFFRISEGDKQQIDKKYQFKMKNAMWNAIPNFGMIVAGGNINPLALTVSLASQIGIGYMNYRKSKAENEIEYENEKWQLQRSAIEQFNGIRRELFDASWKLFEKYKLGDKLRLSEKQIHQYNEILNDYENLNRRYDRLDVIKEYFGAYPPFWYHFGNTANLIAQANKNDKDLYEKYINLAKAHFDEYIKLNEKSILRTDPVASSCYLEYVDLLSPENDEEKIKAYINKATEFSGGENDILQLCVFSYLRIKEFKGAESLLRRLVNENYNRDANGQLLSKLYFTDFLKHEEELKKYEACDDSKEKELNEKDILQAITTAYKELTKRVNPQYLFPLPALGEKNMDTLKADFELRQRYILLGKYFDVFRQFFEKYSECFNQFLPVFDEQQGRSVLGKKLYDDSIESRDYRINQAKKVYDNKTENGEYSMKLLEEDFWKNYLILFDEMTSKLSKLDCVIHIEDAVESVKKKIEGASDNIKLTVAKLTELSFDASDYGKMQDDYNFIYFLKEYIEIICNDAFMHVNNCPVDGEYTIMNSEANLQEFCDENHIDNINAFIINEGSSDVDGCLYRYFGNEILAEISEMRVDQEYQKELIKKVEEYKDSLVQQNSETKLYFKTDEQLRRYFRQNKRTLKGINQYRTIAVIDGKKPSPDLILGFDGITKVTSFIRYKRTVSYSDYEKLDINIKGIDESKLTELLGDLKRIATKDMDRGRKPEGRDDTSIVEIIKNVYNGQLEESVKSIDSVRWSNYSENEPHELIPVFDQEECIYTVDQVPYYNFIENRSSLSAVVEVSKGAEVLNQKTQEFISQEAAIYQQLDDAYKKADLQSEKHNAEWKEMKEEKARIKASIEANVTRFKQ